MTQRQKKKRVIELSKQRIERWLAAYNRDWQRTCVEVMRARRNAEKCGWFSTFGDRLIEGAVDEVSKRPEFYGLSLNEMMQHVCIPVIECAKMFEGVTDEDRN